MKYVLDSSVGLKTVLPEADSSRAIALCTAFRLGAHELLAPDIFPVEAAHALARAERRGLLAPGEASLLLDDLPVPELHSSLGLLSAALDLASRARVGVYDCLYVCLADREDCEFVTADRKLVNAIRKYVSFVVDLASLP